jgi:hypothetical protein
MKKYGFTIEGRGVIEIDAHGEKEAFLKLICKYWGRIEKEGRIVLLGELIEK